MWRTFLFSKGYPVDLSGKFERWTVDRSAWVPLAMGSKLPNESAMLVPYLCFASGFRASLSIIQSEVGNGIPFLRLTMSS